MTAKVIVLFKKEDQSRPQNYRPIAISPVLCKLYSGVLLRRIQDKPEQVRTPEEMGFRKDYSCSDLVHALTMISEQSVGWAETVWIASLDLEKAFDKVLHTAVLKGLKEVDVLWCCESWKLTAARMKRLRSTQRFMLRAMKDRADEEWKGEKTVAGPSRQKDEEWIERIKCATREAEEKLEMPERKIGWTCTWVRSGPGQAKLHI